MATFHYRALRADGKASAGEVEADDRGEALGAIRRLGLSPLTIETRQQAGPRKPRRANRAMRQAADTLISELAVLLRAGLQLDRALALAIENVGETALSDDLVDLLKDVREGLPLSRAMARKPVLFSPTAVAMAEAGEANGRLDQALSRLADMLEQSAELRRLIHSSSIYPLILCGVAFGVIMLMLLYVVPQFEALFASSRAALPTSSAVIMGASRFVRAHGLEAMMGLVIGGLALGYALRQPAGRAAADRIILTLPAIGPLVRRVETARFARTLGALIEGEVPLPVAVQLAQRTITNSEMARAVAKIATGIKEGSGLTGPLAAAGIFPKLAIGFFRTGEESSQLGFMCHRLADVLDRDVRLRLERLIGLLTPAITITLGVTVAAIIASIMSAILGFNDLAVQ